MISHFLSFQIHLISQYTQIGRVNPPSPNDSLYGESLQPLCCNWSLKLLYLLSFLRRATVEEIWFVPTVIPSVSVSQFWPKVSGAQSHKMSTPKLNRYQLSVYPKTKIFHQMNRPPHTLSGRSHWAFLNIHRSVIVVYVSTKQFLWCVPQFRSPITTTLWKPVA